MAIRKSKLLMIALTVSLAVNLAIAGFVGAQWFKHRDFQGRQIGLTFDRHAALSVLNTEDKKRVDKVWRERRSDMHSNFMQYRRAKRQLASLLTAGDLDKEAIEKTQKTMMEGRNKIESVLNTTLFETAKILPPETRVKFFKNGFQRWKSRHRKGGHHPPHPERQEPRQHD